MKSKDGWNERYLTPLIRVLSAALFDTKLPTRMANYAAQCGLATLAMLVILIG